MLLYYMVSKHSQLHRHWIFNYPLLKKKKTNYDMIFI